MVIDKGTIIHINSSTTEGDTRKKEAFCFNLVKVKMVTSIVKNLVE
jgi:hypothetical protein